MDMVELRAAVELAKLEMARRHYEHVGLGADFVEQFIR